MSEPFQLPQGMERFSTKRERLAFAQTSDGTRRLVRIERIAHVEQTLSVAAHQPTGEVVLRQRYAGAEAPTHEDAARIGMAPDEARRIAACMIEAADAVESAQATAEEGSA